MSDESVTRAHEDTILLSPSVLDVGARERTEHNSYLTYCHEWVISLVQRRIIDMGSLQFLERP